VQVFFYTIDNRKGGDEQWHAVKNAEQKRRPKRRQRKNEFDTHAADNNQPRRIFFQPVFISSIFPPLLLN